MDKELELVVNGVYKTYVKDLVQIKGINEKTRQMHLYNITEQCNAYVNIDKHLLVTRIR